MKWLARWWPAIVWAVAISGFSTGTFTSDNTSHFFVPALHWLFPHVPLDTLMVVHHVIRKCGHVAEYFIFGLLILRGVRAGRAGMRWSWSLTVILIVAAYASLDEFHQLFVPGRGAAVTDALLDTAAGAAAQLAVFLFVRKNEGTESF